MVIILIGNNKMEMPERESLCRWWASKRNLVTFKTHDC
jgi:hypothetical protein